MSYAYSCHALAHDPSSSLPSNPSASSAAGSAEVPKQVPFTLKVYDIFSCRSSVTVLRTQDSVSPALDLLRHGYIAKTPALPKVAVSVRTLQLLYRLRQRKASFSIESFAKVVCDYYKVRLSRPFRSSLY